MAVELYDTKRAIYYAKPALRGWLHLLWFGVSLVAGAWLLAGARGAAQLSADAIYAASVSALFGTSALYHRGNWGSRWSQRLQRADHVMIYVLIAGTATPAFLLAIPGAFGVAGLAGVWALTLIAATIHLARMKAPEKVVGATFLGLGWLSGMTVPWVWIREGAWPGALMIAGGVLYTTGAIAYHRRRPDPNPAVFGYHEVLHAFVCVAAACQFAAIAMFVGS